MLDGEACRRPRRPRQGTTAEAEPFSWQARLGRRVHPWGHTGAQSPKDSGPDLDVTPCQDGFDPWLPRQVSNQGAVRASPEPTASTSHWLTRPPRLSCAHRPKGRTNRPRDCRGDSLRPERARERPRERWNTRSTDDGLRRLGDNTGGVPTVVRLTPRHRAACPHEGLLLALRQLDRKFASRVSTSQWGDQKSPGRPRCGDRHARAASQAMGNGQR